MKEASEVVVGMSPREMRWMVMVGAEGVSRQTFHNRQKKGKPLDDFEQESDISDLYCKKDHCSYVWTMGDLHGIRKII